MENGKGQENDQQIWKFKGNEIVKCASKLTVRGVLNKIMENIDPNDPRDVLPLGHGDPSQFPSFRTSKDAVDAIVDAVQSYKFNSYSSNIGIPSAREALAKYLSQDLPHKLTKDDVFLTCGCTEAIETVIAALVRPGANILLPKPGFFYYHARCSYTGLEARHFDLLPDQGWEVDLDNVEALVDENTLAMVIINPGNPCGNVYTYKHLNKIAETAKKLGILVISDEVYEHITFGSNPFVPMGVFGDIVPVITLGSISKRWVVPGWRLGWLVTNDTQGILRKTGVVESIESFLNISADPATFIQGAIPRIIEKTKDSFFSNIIDMLRQNANICYEKLKVIPCLSCPYKPEGSMFVMVKLNVSLLIDIHDDLDFCVKLAKEENIVTLPGTAVSLKNWVRITFAVEQSALIEGLERLEAFCQRHAKIP